MKTRTSLRTFLLGIAVGTLTTASNAEIYAQGVFLPGSGAVNRGMGGATTGAAIEAIGSMYWNPSTISHLPTNEVAFGFETIYTNYSIESSFPGLGSGISEAEIGANPVPTIAWVHHTHHPDVTFGLGIFGVAGFAVNMRGDATNPVLSPPFPLGGAGLGGIRSEATFFQMNPALSIRLTERLSFAAGPTIGMGKIALDDNAFLAWCQLAVTVLLAAVSASGTGAIKMRPGIRRMENAVESDWEFVIEVDWAPARLDAAVGQGQTANLTPGLFLGNIFPKAVLWGIRPGVGLDNGG